MSGVCNSATANLAELALLAENIVEFPNNKMEIFCTCSSKMTFLRMEEKEKKDMTKDALLTCWLTPQ